MNIYLGITIYTLEEILGYLLCYILILKLEVKRKIWIPVYIAITLFVQLVCSYYFGDLLEAAIPLIAGALIPFMGDKKIRKGMMINFIYICLISSIVNVFPMYIVALILGHSVMEWRSAGIITFICRSAFILMELAYYLIVKFGKREGFQVHFNRVQKIAFVIALFCCIIMGAANSVLVENHALEQRGKIAAGIAILIVSIVFLISSLWQGQTMRKNMEMEKNEAKYDYLLKAQEQHINNVIKRDEELRKFRHDIRAHMIVMRDLVEHKKWEQLTAYMNQVEKNTEQNGINYYTGNSTVDAVINDLKTRMEQDEIEFKINGTLALREEIEIFDLCNCIYNLLLNAIEACEKLDNTERKIHMDFANFQKKTYIKVNNRCLTMKEDNDIKELVTDKEDKENHGLGTKNVLETVQKYNGNVTYSTKSGWFTAEIII